MKQFNLIAVPEQFPEHGGGHASDVYVYRHLRAYGREGGEHLSEEGASGGQDGTVDAEHSALVDQVDVRAVPRGGTR